MVLRCKKMWWCPASAKCNKDYFASIKHLVVTVQPCTDVLDHSSHCSLVYEMQYESHCLENPDVDACYRQLQAELAFLPEPDYDQLGEWLQQQRLSA